MMIRWFRRKCEIFGACKYNGNYNADVYEIKIMHSRFWDTIQIIVQFFIPNSNTILCMRLTFFRFNGIFWRKPLGGHRALTIANHIVISFVPIWKHQWPQVQKPYYLLFTVKTAKCLYQWTSIRFPDILFPGFLWLWVFDWITNSYIYRYMHVPSDRTYMHIRDASHTMDRWGAYLLKISTLYNVKAAFKIKVGIKSYCASA